MTDQSRVEAVADALLLCSKMQIDLGKADLMQMAQAAIEANDAWLKARGWKVVPRRITPDMADAEFKRVQERGHSSQSSTWQDLYDAAPSPEEPDR